MGVVLGVDVGRGLIFKLEALFFKCFHDLGAVPKRDENVIGEICRDEEDGSG